MKGVDMCKRLVRGRVYEGGERRKSELVRERAGRRGRDGEVKGPLVRLNQRMPRDLHND